MLLYGVPAGLEHCAGCLLSSGVERMHQVSGRITIPESHVQPACAIS